MEERDRPMSAGCTKFLTSEPRSDADVFITSEYIQVDICPLFVLLSLQRRNLCGERPTARQTGQFLYLLSLIPGRN